MDMKKKYHEYVKIKDLKDMFQKTVETYPDNVAYCIKTGDPEKKYKDITYRELEDQVNSLGTILIEMGLKDKRIAIISENRYEWGMAYLAIVNGTGVVVPLDKALPANEIESLIIRSGVEAIIYSNKYDDVMMDIKNRNTTDLRYYISMDASERKNQVLSLKELVQKGHELVEQGDRKYLDAKIEADKMSIMLFTSGTTSKSKAVMLSHKNICSNLMDICAVITLNQNDTLLSFLPLHHTFECTVGFLYPMYVGARIVFCDGIRHIAENIKEYQVSAMISVPILFESMYRRIMKNIEKAGKLERVQKGIKISNLLLKFGIDKRKEIFSEIHATLGGKLRLFVSGAAALDPEVEKGFNDLGIKTLQGYGLTEMSPVLATENDVYTKNGSVGKVMPSLKVKIIDKNKEGIGEIIAKGPSVMLGYYHNDEANQHSLKDGWFYTGDLGYIDKDDFLYVTGRKKSVIVLKNGKNVYPEELENLVNRIEGVKESFVYGLDEEENDPVICVKIVYDKDIMKDVYGAEEEEKIQETLWNKVKEINKTMPAYKYIRHVQVTEKPLIKTTTQKIKRFEEMKEIEKNMKM